MLLAVDIGNTTIALGVFEGDCLIKHWRLSSVRDRTADELGAAIRQIFAFSKFDYRAISAVIASSVVPQIDFSFAKMSESYLGQQATFVDADFDFGLKIKYNPPSAIGVDRLVVASAAVRKYGAPVVVGDFGTATTVDAVNSSGEFLGGIIAPGMNLFADALHQKTAKLPLLTKIEKPARVIGSSTVESIQAGIYFGYVGLVEGIVSRMIGELGDAPRVVATGGFAALIAGSTERIETVDENLLLDGLRMIHGNAETRAK